MNYLLGSDGGAISGYASLRASAPCVACRSVCCTGRNLMGGTVLLTPTCGECVGAVHQFAFIDLSGDDETHGWRIAFGSYGAGHRWLDCSRSGCSLGTFEPLEPEVNTSRDLASDFSTRPSTDPAPADYPPYQRPMGSSVCHTACGRTMPIWRWLIWWGRPGK